jgi:hypothetical protein
VDELAGMAGQRVRKRSSFNPHRGIQGVSGDFLGKQDRQKNVTMLGNSTPLHRHQTDFSPEKLKEIYDQAGLKILDNVM